MFLKFLLLVLDLLVYFTADGAVVNRTLGLIPAHIKLSNKNFYLGIHFKADYFQATEFCNYHGLHLATINNQLENDKLVDFARILGKGNDILWISGTDLSAEGQFVWMSTGIPFSYTNWIINQPDNDKGMEDCVHMLPGGKWNDYDCNAKFYFVCEF